MHPKQGSQPLKYSTILTPAHMVMQPDTRNMIRKAERWTRQPPFLFQQSWSKSVEGQKLHL